MARFRKSLFAIPSWSGNTGKSHKYTTEMEIIIPEKVGTSDPGFMAKHNEKPTNEYLPWPYDPSVYDKAYFDGDQEVKRRVELSLDWIGEINSGIFRNWDEIESLKALWDGPFVLKGIQSREVYVKYIWI